MTRLGFTRITKFERFRRLLKVFFNGFTLFYLMLHGFTGFYPVLPDFRWFLLNFT